MMRHIVPIGFQPDVPEEKIADLSAPFGGVIPQVTGIVDSPSDRSESPETIGRDGIHESSSTARIGTGWKPITPILTTKCSGPDLTPMRSAFRKALSFRLFLSRPR